MARPNNYDRVIPPNIDKIKQWLADGVPEKDIAKNLGIGYTTWRRWKKDCGEFEAVVVNTRKPQIEELENRMYRLATGYTFKVKKAMKVRDAGGGEHIEFYQEEIHVPPSFNALRFLLTNWSNEYSNDPAAIKQRIEEFEHKKKMDELNMW